ncbi:MAG: hypothetical protein CMN76_12140 [Spirochaetaceae bacterium]|nr:hypothetical protein [Spirochaetaceae bacterium]|tara:strand:+ start:53825 stop:54217 length:393 start_codon:yes stop_codon:yes gene_type:complete
MHSTHPAYGNTDYGYSVSPIGMMIKNAENGAKWAKFCGVMTIIGGCMYCLGIITATVGIPMIFMGLRAMKASDRVLHYLRTKNHEDALASLTEYGSYFKIQGILALVGIALTIVASFIYLVIAIVLIVNR